MKMTNAPDPMLFTNNFIYVNIIPIAMPCGARKEVITDGNNES